MKLWHGKPQPPPDDPSLAEAEARVVDVGERAARVLTARRFLARDDLWAAAVLEAIRGPRK